MELTIGKTVMQVGGLENKRYIDLVSNDGKIQVRIIAEENEVSVIAISGKILVEHDRAYPAIRIEKT